MLPGPALRARKWLLRALAAAAAPPLAFYSYGIAGPLSVLGTVFAAQWLVCQYRGAPRPFVPPAWRWPLAAAGCFLYASTLGFIDWDLYRLGYEAYARGILAVPIGLVAIALRRHGWGSWGVLIALWLWFLDLLHSANMWDAVLDGVLWIVALCGLLAQGWARIHARRHANSVA